MSPDIEWRIGEDAEEETVAQTSSRPLSRGRKALLLIVVSAGIGLGVWYKSIPAPITPAPPIEISTATPTPTPPPPMESLPTTIAREAQALASGNQQRFMALQDSTDRSWPREQAALISQPWDLPVPDQLFYTIVSTGTLSGNRAWAEVAQYRAGQYFRELRFYRFAPQQSRWLRTRPGNDAAVWGQMPVVANPTEHFVVLSDEREVFDAWEIARQLEQQYAAACHAIGCWGISFGGTHASDRYFTLALLPTYTHPSMHTDDMASHVTVTLPSPLIMGLYQADVRLPDLSPDERLNSYFDQLIYPWLIYNVSGGYERWSKSRAGLILVWAISNWGQLRQGRPSADATPRWPEIVDRLQAQPLEALWAWSDNSDEDQQQLSLANATALVQFIDTHYGPDKVIALLRAIDQAHSLPAALEASGLSYTDIVAQWSDWLQTLRAS